MICQGVIGLVCVIALCAKKLRSFVINVNVRKLTRSRGCLCA